MKTRVLLFIVLCAALGTAGQAAVKVQEQANGQKFTGVLVNGSAVSKYDIVFVGDGFREADQAAFNTAVDAAVAALRARPGYAENMCGFNIWRVNVLSTQQGIDHPKDGILKNTELDCRYGNPAASEAERCIVSDSPEKCFEAAAYAPARDATFVLVNDTRWGGCAGAVVCSSIATGFAGIITHELGHQLSDLADEYDCYVCDGTDDGRTYAGSDLPEVNVTTNTNRATTKWHDLIAATTAIPTISDTPPGVVGLWEGGGYYKKGIFRPQESCHMRTTANEFCAVCARKVQGNLGIRCTAVFDFLKYRRIIWREKFRFPIPLCLSCPRPEDNNPLDRVSIRLAGLPREVTVRIIDSKGNVIAEARHGEGGTILDFAANRSEVYSAEFTPGADLSAPETTVDAELIRNGKLEQLPSIGRR